MNAIKKRVLLLLIFIIAILLLIVVPIFVRAGVLTSRSNVLETSRHATASRQTYQFTTETALVIDAGTTGDFSFKLNFPFDAGGDPFTLPNLAAGDVTATCTSCGGLTLTIVDVIENNEGGHSANDSALIRVDAGTSGSLPAASVVTVIVGTGATKITNPADNADGCLDGATAADADVCSIRLDTTESLTNAITSVDNGDVLVALISAVTVSATVNETLSFSINGVTSGNCSFGTGDGSGTNDDNTTSSTVPFGTLATTNAFNKACQDLAVSTNAANGYNLTGEESTNLRTAGGVNIPDTTCDGTSCTESTFGAWATATNSGLGHSCRNQTNTPCAAGYDSGGNFRYRQFACKGSNAECDPGSGGETQQTIMSSAGPADTDTGRLHYKLAISPVQAPGDYTTLVTYIATPIF